MGGETVFPDAAVKVTGPGWSDCALAGLAVKVGHYSFFWPGFVKAVW